MKDQDYQKWKDYLFEKYPDEKSIHDYLERFKDSKYPIIFNLKHLALILGIDKQVLANIVNSPENYYRTFAIKKRNGNDRQITSPLPTLKYIQRWILLNILENNKINSASTGFIKNKSILDNVTPHLASNCILKLDLEDYFPSIKLKRVYSAFKYFGYSKKVSFYLARLCCYNNALPQGASTSPYLSNIITKKLDSRLFHFSKHFSLSYTRYADDLTFSGSHIPWIFVSYINKIIENSGFTVNTNKTSLVKGKSKKIVTGISVSGSKPMIPRNYKRKLRHETHILLTMRPEIFRETLFRNDPVYIERVLGKLNYLLFVEKENSFAKKSLLRIREYCSNLNNS